MRLHILRTFYIVYTQTKCLHEKQQDLDPKLFGYEEIDDLLVPAKIKIILPPLSELVPNCTCKVCVSKL